VYHVIPSENASLARTEGFRCGTFKLTSAGFGDYARDDPVIS
jgi:glycine/serine hydroxymethyltransferase